MPELSRRTFVRGSLAAGGTGLLSAALPAATAHAAEVTVSDTAGTVTLAADDATGAIRVLDAGGAHRLTLTHFKYSDTARTFGASSVTAIGPTELHIEYATQHPAVTVRAVIVAGLRKARIRWEVSGAEAVPDEFAISRAVVNGTETYDPVVLWNRDAGGGIPYETTHGAGYAMTYADNRLLLRLRESTPGFGDATWIHAPGTTQPDGTAVTEAVIVPGLMRSHSAGVIARDIATPLGVDLWTDQPFNLWNTGGSKTVRAQVVNAETTARSVRVAWTARTWDGAVQSGTTGPATVAARSVWNTSFPVTLGGRDVAFVEAVVTDAADANVTAFARTNLAVLSTYAYQAGDASTFGLANYPWLLRPSQNDVAGLMGLLGMKWVRTAYDGAPGIPPSGLDQLGFRHNVQLGEIPYGGTTEQKETWAAGMVDLCVDSGARYYECGNELNLTAPERTPKEYVDDALLPLGEAIADRADATFKVMTCGLAGLDEVWLDGFTTAGGWAEVDVLAYHPGRGNYVADYDPPEPWLESDGRRKPVFWNFIGSLRKAHEARTVNGGKELWLTEAYASTQPNRWWTDTYRHSAENVLLQLMFAKAFDVRCVTWYTLDDGIIQQPMEAHPGNIEYHYGLLGRDRSPKPSLLAFATAARFLDQAEYLGRVTFADPEVKGLLFSAPAGRFAVLWTRRDGYVLNNDSARRDPDNAAYYRTPEPWLDPWPTKTPVTLPTPAATTTVRELNAVGQETLHTAAGGQVTVTLDGAPRIFVGLDLTTTDTYPVL